MACVPASLVHWWNELRAKGLVLDETVRTIIDIDWGRNVPVKVFHETYANERMFNTGLTAMLEEVEKEPRPQKHPVSVDVWTAEFAKLAACVEHEDSTIEEMEDVFRPLIQSLIQRATEGKQHDG